MQQIKLLFQIYCLFIILLSSTFCIAEETTSTKYEWNIPTLAVISDINGNIVSQSCSKSKFSMTYNNSSDILRVSTSDDTPLGSGDTIRNNVWLAAVSAALQRNETLSGWHISIDFSGNVDGPSSGAITALYILSALDGRTPPEDFAATGTIMPDGTIGPVGGVAYKLEAAAESGMKKVCIPAFIRFEPQPDGSLIDLAEKAEQLGIELILAENLEEAYAAMHDLPSKFIMVDDVKKISAIPKATEKALIELFLEKNEAVDNMINAIPEATREELIEDSFFQDIIITPYKTAQQYFIAGKILPALNDIMLSFIGLNSYNLAQNPSFYEKYFQDSATDFSALLSWQRPDYNLLLELSRYNDKKLADFSFTYEYSRSAENRSEFSAQLCDPNGLAKSYGMGEYYASLLPPENLLQQLSDEELQEFALLELISRPAVYNFIVEYSNFIDMYDEITGTLPRLEANSKLSVCENFFYQAAMATCNNLYVFLNEYPEMASSISASLDDSYYYIYDSMLNNVIEMHDLRGVADPEYQKVASIIAQIELLTTAYAMMLPLDSAPDRLDYLMSSARNQALRSIRSCTNRGIVCLYSIEQFQEAETAKTDPLTAIPYYWQAELSAKALKIIFE